MTPGSNLQALFGGGGGDQPQPEASAADALGQQLQQLQIQAMMIARSNPATAPVMRQIIQLSQTAVSEASKSSPAATPSSEGVGGGMSAGPMSSNY